jgi:hypothetical protein
LAFIKPNSQDDEQDWKLDLMHGVSVYLRERKSSVVAILAPF